MKKKIADLWIKALRSGKYKQVKGTLKDKNGFCCLGVLCDISKLSKWVHEHYYLDCSSGLPTQVNIWSGVKDPLGLYKTKDDTKSLASLNDSGKTFNDIADIIEEKWKDL